MTPLKIAMLSLTHGHTRKYYQTLSDSPKLTWLAALVRLAFESDRRCERLGVAGE